VADALVVDASVVAKWHLPDEDDVAIARGLLVRFAAGELVLVAPDVIRHEVASAITVATLGRNPRLTVQAGEDAIADFLATGIRTVADDALSRHAYQLVHQHGCAFYDALYLALAERLHIPFVTADGRLHQRIGHLPDVIWLGNYVPPPAS
jgi:predicted nucleic acid-binding protein